MREAALDCRAREKIKMEWKTRALEHDVDGGDNDVDDDGDVVFVDNDDYNKKKQSGGKKGNKTPAADTTNMKKAKPCTTKKGTEYCSDSSDSSDDDNISDVWCDHCRIGGELLKCEGGCAKSYHAACVAANPNDLPDPWLCPNCIYVQRANDMADLPPSNLAGETILPSAFYCSAISMYSHLSSLWHRSRT